MKSFMLSVVVVLTLCAAIGAQSGPAKASKSLTHLGCKGLSDAEKQRLIAEIIAQLPKSERGPQGIQGPIGPQGGQGPKGDKPSQAEIADILRNMVDEYKDDFRPKPPSRTELIKLMREVFEEEKGELKGDKGDRGEVNVIVQWGDGKIIGRQNGAASGGTVNVYLDKREVARALRAEEK